MQYRPEIDGLRAVAVLPVIGFHAGFAGFSGGFIGVDVFFVISGYLITQILVGDLTENRYSIARFYERRARRILPALSVVLLASILAAHLILLPPLFKDFSASIFAVALFLSNILFIAEVDYFGPGAHETPLLHTWSLAVEEQFYLLFPLLLWLFWRIGGRRALWLGIGAIVLASLAFSEWAWRVYPAQTFYLLPSRAWELGAGALCALVPLAAPGTRPGLLRQAIALAGLGAILAGVVFLDRTYPFPSFWAAIPVLGSVAVILAATPGTLAAAILSTRAVVGIGLISYSAYLWHNPIFVFAYLSQGSMPPTGVMLALAGLSLALAALTWRLVEQPFRQRRGAPAPWLPRRGQVFAATGAVTLAFAGFGLWGFLSEGRASLWLAGASESQRQTYALYDDARERDRRSDFGPCQFTSERLSDTARARITECAALHGPGLAIIGDSHAIDLAQALMRADPPPFAFALTKGGCRPAAGDPECDLDAFAAMVAAQPDLFERAIFEMAGQHMIIGPGGRLAEDIFALYPLDTPMPEGDLTLNLPELDAAEAYLRALSDLLPVIWLTPRIEPHIEPGQIIAAGCDADFALRPGQAALFDRLVSEITARVAHAPGITVIDQNRALNFTMPRDFMTCEALYWRDADHLSRAGVDWLRDRLAPVLLAPR